MFHQIFKIILIFFEICIICTKTFFSHSQLTSHPTVFYHLKLARETNSVALFIKIYLKDFKLAENLEFIKKDSSIFCYANIRRCHGIR